MNAGFALSSHVEFRKQITTSLTFHFEHFEFLTQQEYFLINFMREEDTKKTRLNIV